MSVKQWLLSLVVLFVVAVVAVWCVYSVRPLVHEVTRELPQAREVPRAPHVTPVEGSFDERVRDLERELDSWLAADQTIGASTTDLLYEVADGQRPLADVPDPVWQVLADHRTTLESLLLATHAQRRRPDGTWVFAETPYSPIEVFTVSKYVPLEILRQLEDHDAARALEVCIDSMALGRDVSTNLLSAMIGSSIQKNVSHACVTALAASDPQDARAARATLAQILEATPSAGEILHERWLAVQAIEYLPRAAGVDLREIDPSAARAAGPGAPQPVRWMGQAPYRLRWKAEAAYMQRVIEAAQDHDPSALQALDEARDTIQRPLYWLGLPAPWGPVAELAVELETQQAELHSDLLGAGRNASVP